MQFMVYSTEETRANTPAPTPEVMAGLGQLTEEGFKTGVLVTTGGASNSGTRVKLAGGKYTVTDGPFIEAKELMGGFAVLNVKSLEEAIAWSKRFRDIVGEGETEIVQIFGPSDFLQG